jgi:hypothetical protein
MTKEEVISIRNFITAINHTNLTDGVVRPLTYQVMLDNEHGINTSMTPTAWDDTNERFYAFSINSYDYQGSVNYGTSKTLNPGMVTIADYNEIQGFKVAMTEVDFDKMCDAINTAAGTTIITDVQRENIRIKLYRATDPEWQISQRKSGSY